MRVAGVTVFDESEIRSAVEAQRRSYRLLRWVGDAIQRGFIRLERAHRYSNDAEAAGEWLAEHFANLPDDCRPEERTGPSFVRFANVFASFLLTSFDLVDHPGVRVVSECGGAGCWCPICTHLVAAPYLQPKKLGSREKRRSERLMHDFLEETAAESEVPLLPDRASALLGDAALRRDVTLAAYGKELLRRCNGHATGPEVLALWRQFAWKPTGSPIRGFELQASAIIDAERHIREALRADGGAMA